jgi:hypothetical protein
VIHAGDLSRVRGYDLCGGSRSLKRLFRRGHLNLLEVVSYYYSHTQTVQLISLHLKTPSNYFTTSNYITKAGMLLRPPASFLLNNKGMYLLILYSCKGWDF